MHLIEKHISQHSAEKLLGEMNSKPQRLTQKHCFTYESEEDQTLLKKLPTNKRPGTKPDEQRGFRPHTAGGAGKLTGDYMKPTVNADLKKQGEKT